MRVKTQEGNEDPSDHSRDKNIKNNNYSENKNNEINENNLNTSLSDQIISSSAFSTSDNSNNNNNSSNKSNNISSNNINSNNISSNNNFSSNNIQSNNNTDDTNLSNNTISEKSRDNERIKRHSDNSGTRSFVAGLTAGLASTVAGYVPDTIKVRLQTQPLHDPIRYKGALDCVSRMVREEGVGSLFRGMSTPLLSRAVVNGLCFSSYTLIIKALHDPHAHSPSSPLSPSPSPSLPPLPFVFLAGGCAGAVSALVASPTELIKVQMQLGIVVGGPLHHMRVLVRQAGLRGLLMLGMVPTVMRDFVCMGTFFATTSEFSRAIATRYPNSPVSHLAALLGGAMAGVAGWALCYPLDVWKSNVQQLFGGTPISGNSKQSMSFMSFFKQRYKARGIRGFYSGLGPTLFRAIPVNATKYFAFDLVLRIFQAM